MKLLISPCAALLLLVAPASADIVWTGAVSNDIFDEANWDLSNSSVTTIDPNVSIVDNVVIRNAPAPVEIPELPGQMRFQVEDGFLMTVDNSTVVALGNDGIGSFPGAALGVTVDVVNGASLETFFVVNEITVDVDATSSATFGGGGNPVNLSYVNLTLGAGLAFLLEDPTEYRNEHLSKTTVDGIPAVEGQNITIASDGAMGSIITVIPQLIGTSYCGANTNSTGAAAAMSATGSAGVAANNLVLACDALPSGSFAFFLTSQAQGLVTNPGGSEGNLCLGGAIGRFVGPGQIQNSGTAGAVSLTLDLTAQPTPTGLVAVAAGETWNYQCWFRDVGMTGAAVSNFSDGLEIAFN